MPKAVRMRSDMSAFAAAIEKSNGQDVTSSPCHVLAVTLFYSFFLRKNGSTAGAAARFPGQFPAGPGQVQ